MHTVIGYGSLMSGYGRARHAAIHPRGVRRVQLHNARRGFGKASIHADRLAMVLEPLDPSQPLTASTLPDGAIGEPPQAVALQVSAAELPAVARREGYAPSALNALVQLAAAAGGDLASYLASVMMDSDGDLVAYRERLYARLGYTSPHYIPHPIAVGDQPALIFLAAGAEGSGSAEVVPVRVRTGSCDLLDVAAVWRAKPSDAQLDYIAMCLLAAGDAVRVDDLFDRVPEDLRARLDEILADHPEARATLRALLG